MGRSNLIHPFENRKTDWRHTMESVQLLAQIQAFTALASA